MRRKIGDRRGGRRLPILSEEEKLQRVLTGWGKVGDCNRKLKANTGLAGENSSVYVVCGSYIWKSGIPTLIQCNHCKAIEERRRKKEQEEFEIRMKAERKRKKEEARANFDPYEWTGGDKLWVVRTNKFGMWCKPMPVIRICNTREMYEVIYPQGGKPYFYFNEDIFETYDEALAAFIERDIGYED